MECLRETERQKPHAGPAVHDDLVNRDFTADRVDELWLTDIPEHKTGEGKLYLCAIKDVCSNRIVGYSIDSRMRARLAVDALDMAVKHRGYTRGVVVQSDMRNSISYRAVRSCVEASRAARLDGPCWRVWR